jgi:hypothetical protein
LVLYTTTIDFYFILFLAVVEIEFRPHTCQVDPVSLETHPPALFSYFSYGVLCFCLGLASQQNPATYTSCIAGIADMNHHTQLIN